MRTSSRLRTLRRSRLVRELRTLPLGADVVDTRSAPGMRSRWPSAIEPGAGGMLCTLRMDMAVGEPGSGASRVTAAAVAHSAMRCMRACSRVRNTERVATDAPLAWPTGARRRPNTEMV